MAGSRTAPRNSEDLRQAILDRYEGLSKRLQQIARYVLDEPNAVALETLAVIADRCGVQPSAIVRFAKAIGFESASQMQKVIRDGLIAGSTVLGYGERVRQFSESVDSREVGSPGNVLAEFIEGNVLAINNLRELVDAKAMKQAVRLIAEADTVYIVGVRRSLPVAAYFAYSLQQLGKKCVLVDSMGGMAAMQMNAIGRGDLLAAVSYRPYADETVQAVHAAVEAGADVLTISDSLVSPVAKPATLVLQVREAEIRKFRTLSASMCLVQSIAISYAFDTARAPAKSKSRRGA